MFNTPQLKGVAQEVEDTIVKTMEEAVSSCLAGLRHPWIIRFQVIGNALRLRKVRSWFSFVA